MDQQFITNYLSNLNAILSSLEAGKIQQIIEVIFRAYRKGKQIFIMGNGGSAALASHFACDLGKGTLNRVYDPAEKRFRVMSLTDNVAVLTAFANDLSYDDVFVQQLNNLVNEGDVVIAISGSGNSRNVIKAIGLAKQFKATTIAFLGFDGGKLKNLVDYKVIVKSNNYGVIEDTHSALTHLIAAALASLKREVK